ncbi:hypothetical protein CGGC5_v016262 [Colletotrichum fructicola Nara gc5]|uniref:Uncharacterized protein n=1 Tax=Colletotrichum fructicola (strain Nara gc5) TaxID=1213859 RepID=A0A7J6IEI4_COLFN|nr:hypothetical protein CGGC5_v016262 [Colletotrichum fructicola Nara gc5]
MQFSKVLCVLFPVAVLAAPLQTFNIPTMDPNTVAPEVPAIGKRRKASSIGELCCHMMVSKMLLVLAGATELIVNTQKISG